MDNNLDDILDGSIDDLKDLPEFKAPHTGIYNLTVTLERKDINKKPAMVAHYVIVDTVSLEDDTIPEGERSKPGDKFDTSFILKDEEGQRSELAEGFFKAFMAPFHVHYNDKSIRNVAEHLKSAHSITAKIYRKERSKEKGKFDAQVSEIVIA